MCKYLVVKSEPKCVKKKCRFFFIDFLVQASICAFEATKLKLKPWGQSHVVYLHRKFQLRIFSILEKKSGQQDPLKLRKIVVPQNREWHHQNKKSISNLNEYQSVLKISWISVEICFIKIVRKIIKISIIKRKKNQ